LGPTIFSSRQDFGFGGVWLQLIFDSMKEEERNSSQL
jgi:hypothetical protein